MAPFSTMAITKEWNPVTGTWYEEDWNPHTGELTVHTKQDVQPVLDYCKSQRNSGVNDKVGDFAHYATIPATVEVQLKQKGISLHDKNCTPRLIREIETNYPYLKTTNLKHAVKHE